MERVADVMARDVVCIGPDEPVRKALELLGRGAFRRLPVVESGRLVGILCDRDLRQAMNSPVLVHERGQDDYLLDHVQVGNCMTTDVLTISPEDALETAAKQMRARKIGGLPVLQEDKLVGIITESDLLGYLIRCLEAGKLF